MGSIGGAAVGAHLAVVAKRRGRQVAEVSKPPPLPSGARHIWSAFVELSSARQSGFSVQPISYQEIAAYQLVTKNRLSGWDVDQIRVLDDAYLAAVAEAQKRKGPPP